MEFFHNFKYCEVKDMIKIRKNVFETNSSSMHSIAITKRDGRYTRQEIDDENQFTVENGVLVIDNEDDLFFGWGFELLTTFYEKLLYAIASYEACNGEILDAVRKAYPEVTAIKMIKEDGELVDAYGGLDHQSIGTLQSFLSRKDITVEDFLYNKEYIAVIDNDNTCTWDNYMMSGVFNLEHMEG